MKKSQPNFFIVGASKCGTSALVNALSLHPQMFMSNIKELNFFSEYDLPDSKIYQKDFDNYLRHFEAVKNEKIIGEASVSYLARLKAAQWISKFCPRARILILIRNPLTRTRSMYEMYVRDGYKESFQRAIEKDGFLIGQNLYYDRIKRYFDAFPSNQIMIVQHEDLLLDWQTEIKKILTFLEIDKQIQVPEVTKNIGGIPRNRLFALSTNRTAIDFSKRLIPKIIWGPLDKLIKQIMFEKIVLTETQIDILKLRYREDIDKLDQLLGLGLFKKWLDL